MKASTAMPTTEQQAGEVHSSGPRVRAVPAVSRAIAILRLLGSSPSPLTLKEIAKALELVPSTCLHILRALVEERLVSVDAVSKRYTLGVGMLPLARAALEKSGFATVVQPELERLSKRYGLTAIGVEMVGLEHMIVLALSRAPALMRLDVDVGSRFPALISATGRCVAAFSNHAWGDIERNFRKLRWEKAPELDTWRAEVEEVKKKGYSIDRGNYINGVTIIAVPVLDRSQRMFQSIVVIGLAEQINNSTAINIAQDMRTAAETVTSQMYAL